MPSNKNHRTITKFSDRKDCVQVLRAKKQLKDLDGTRKNLYILYFATTKKKCTESSERKTYC